VKAWFDQRQCGQAQKRSIKANALVSRFVWAISACEGVLMSDG